MREILFRGKDPETEVWYEGQYIHLHKTTYCFKEDYDRNPDNDIHQIVFERMTDWGLPNEYGRVDVDPSTVGEYTGLLDKNGRKVFEGDIIEHHVQADIMINRGVVEWDERDGRWSLRLNTMNPGFYMHNPNAVEIIGNVHDNPELLEGGEGNG